MGAFVALSAAAAVSMSTADFGRTNSGRSIRSLPLGDCRSASLRPFQTYWLLKSGGRLRRRGMGERLPSVLCVRRPRRCFLAARRAGAVLACWRRHALRCTRRLMGSAGGPPLRTALLAASASFMLLIVAGWRTAARRAATPRRGMGPICLLDALRPGEPCHVPARFTRPAVVVAAGSQAPLAAPGLVVRSSAGAVCRGGLWWLCNTRRAFRHGISAERRVGPFRSVTRGRYRGLWGETASGAARCIASAGWLAAALSRWRERGASLGAAAAAGDARRSTRWRRVGVLHRAGDGDRFGAQQEIGRPAVFSTGWAGVLLWEWGRFTVRAAAALGRGGGVLGLCRSTRRADYGIRSSGPEPCVTSGARSAEASRFVIFMDSNSALIASINAWARAQRFRRGKPTAAFAPQYERSVGAAPGFWLILYKPEKSPILDVIAEWTASRAQGKYGQVEDKRFAKVAVKHWRKP